MASLNFRNDTGTADPTPPSAQSQPQPNVAIGAAAYIPQNIGNLDNPLDPATTQAQLSGFNTPGVEPLSAASNPNQPFVIDQSGRGLATASDDTIVTQQEIAQGLE